MTQYITALVYLWLFVVSAGHAAATRRLVQVQNPQQQAAPPPQPPVSSPGLAASVGDTCGPGKAWDTLARVRITFLFAEVQAR